MFQQSALYIFSSRVAILGAPVRDANWAGEACAILVARGESLTPIPRGFFQLGNTIAWLTNQLDHWYRTLAVLMSLETFAVNPYMEIDHRYAHVVSQLVELLTPYREYIADDERESLREQVLSVIAEIPPLEKSEYDTRLPDWTSEWTWANSQGDIVPVRQLGPFIITARSPKLYEVTADEMDGRVLVTCDSVGWHCAMHTEASYQEPCRDLEVVLDATSGGNPVTQARLILVRSE